MIIAIPIREFNKTGGISRNIVEIVRVFAKHGHEIHVFSRSFDYTINGITGRIYFHKIPTPISSIFSWLKGTKLHFISFFIEQIEFIFVCSIILFIFRKRFDIIWNNGVGEVLYQNVITVTSCHREYIKMRIDKGDFKWCLNPIHYLALFMEKVNVSKYKKVKIVTVSNLTKWQIIKHYKIPESRILVIYHGVNLSEFYYDKQLKRKEGEEYRLLFVGNQFKLKGLDTLFKALAIIKDKFKVKLYVIGNDINYQDIFEKLSQRMGISDNVVFVGKTDKVQKYYHISDIFVLPTRLDAFGMVILEAMACGLPVITTKNAGASELICHMENGILISDPENYIELSKQIMLLCDNKTLRKKLSKNAVITATNYSWEKVGMKYLEVFEKALYERKKLSLNYLKSIKVC